MFAANSILTESKLHNRTPFLYLGIAILLFAAAGGWVWVNYQFTDRENGGNDFAVYWNSARTVLYDNATPYGELASAKSQNTIFGIARRAGDPPSLLDLPFHIEVLIFPFAVINNYHLAWALWLTFLEISIVGTVFLCFRFLHWKPNPVVGAGIILFSIFFVHGLWAVILGNAVILAGLLIAGVILALRQDQDELAGILLALSTFKFLTIGIFLIFILLWAVIKRRKRLFFPFVMTLGLLIVLSFFFFSNWFLPYARAIFTNLKFGDWLTPAKLFKDELPNFGEKLGWIFSGLLAIVLFVEWWLAAKKDFVRMLWTAALTLAITPLLGLPTYPQNYIVLIIPLIITLSIISYRWRSSDKIVINGLLIILFVGIWGIAIYSPNAKSALFFPLPVSVICLLYWIRWWAVSSPREQSDLSRI